MPPKTSTRKKPSLVNRIVASLIPPDRGRPWESAAKIFAAAGLFLVPILVVSWSSDAWELHKLTALIIAVLGGWVMLVVAMLKRGSDRWTWHPLDILILLFGLVVTVSTITSVNLWTSLFGAPGWLSHSLIATWTFIGLYFLVARVFSAPHDRRLVWTILLTSLAVSMTMQVFQFADLSFLPSSLASSRWFSTIGNLNLHVTIAAAILGMALLALWSTEDERWIRWVLAAGVVLSWIVLFFSGRTLGWAIFALGMVLVVFHQSREERKVNLRLIGSVVVIAAVGLVAQLLGVSSHSGLPAFNELTLDQGTTIDTTITTLAHRPVLGSGPSTWYDDFVKYRPLSYNETSSWSVRFVQGGNAWSQLLATTGIAGGLIFLGLLLLGFTMTWRGWRQTGDPFLLISAFVILATFVTGFFTIWSLTLLAMVWAALGLARTTVGEWDKAKVRRVPAWGYAALSLGAVIIIAGLVPFGGVYLSDWLTHSALNQMNAGKPVATVMQTLKTAVKLNGHNADAAKLLASAYGRQIQDAVTQKKTTEAVTALKNMNSVLSAIIRREPNDPQLYEADNQILNALANIIPDAIAQAKTNFATMRSIEPSSPIQDVGYGQTVLSLLAQQQQAGTVPDKQAAQDISTAIDAFNQALEKKPNYFQARLSKMQAYVTAKRYDDALALYGDISAYSPIEQAYIDLVRGQALDGLKKPLEAAQAVVEAIAVYPNDASLYVTASGYYVKAAKKAEAKTVLEAGQKLYPKDTGISDALKALGT